MASVKWLTQIIVTDRPHTGFWQTLDYSYWERQGGLPALRPVTAMQPKAIIVRPGLNAVVPAGKPVSITGKAWAGENPVARVEFSADGGNTWAAARLDETAKPYCWRDWSFDWKPAAPGPAKLLARCTDDKGNTQPAARDADRRTYMINHLIPVDVLVR
jgi:DMSO/TMAO reductase YedYZ molybdopterin-dependent catalytic subunit